MSENVFRADNQQGSLRQRANDPSETTRRAPYSQNEIKAYFLVQKDKEKIQALKKILTSLKIGTGKIHNPSKRVDPDYWRIYVSSDCHNIFGKTIGSWHPRKIRILRKRMKI